MKNSAALVKARRRPHARTRTEALRSRVVLCSLHDVDAIFAIHLMMGKATKYTSQEDSSTTSPEQASDNQINSVVSKLALTIGVLFLIGFKTEVMSCDVQRKMKQSMALRNFMLFTVIFIFYSYDAYTNLASVFLFTCVTYLLYLLSSKAKWEFAAMLLVLLVVHRVIHMHYESLPQGKARARWDAWKTLVSYVTIVTILVGAALYVVRQKLEHGENFDIVTFLFSDQCTHT